MHPLQLLFVTGLSFLIALGLTAMGFLVAWKLDSTQGFHAVVNLFLIPMWLLSGALFPAAGASEWIRWVMRLNPLTYGMAALREVLYWPRPATIEGPSLGVSLAVTAAFALVTCLAALWLVGQPSGET